MVNGKRVLAVVPARGGSKGIPLKNLRTVSGRPLVALAAETVRAVNRLEPCIDRAVVSTDHLLIRDAAVDAGLDAPFLRPESLSGDRIGDLDVLTHALEATEADDGMRYDVVLMLQPTSPTRRPEQVLATLRKLVDEDLDSVWTVSPTDLKAHPLKQLTIGAGGRMGYFDPRGAAIIARQQLEPVYHRNGVAYALTRQCLLEQRQLLGARAGAVVIDEPMANIDTLDDLARAEQLVAAQLLAGQGDEDEARARVAAETARRVRRLVVDIDGVLAAASTDPDYSKAEPMTANIAALNALHGAGCEIVIYTARGSATGIDWADVTRAQLQRWGVRYDELRFGKPHADVYIDDRLLTLPLVLSMLGVAVPPAQGDATNNSSTEGARS
jgi:CMP-N,N'-diacetyllegionaminic acid synthase